MKSILQDKKDRRCYLCALVDGDNSEKLILQEHHIFEGTANRRNSEKYGMKVYLCPKHHVGDIDGVSDAVHRPDLNNYGLVLKVVAEEVFCQTHRREEFRAIFGRSWSGWNMNSVVLMGRLTRDPMVRYAQGGEQQIAIARYTLAVDRRRRQGDEQATDFISCVAFGKNGEFAEKWLRKGMRICIHGRIQTGSYEKDGQKVYTMDIVADTQEFAESKSGNAERDSYYDAMAAGQQGTAGRQQDPLSEEGFMNIPDGIDEELPFT